MVCYPNGCIIPKNPVVVCALCISRSATIPTSYNALKKRYKTETMKAAKHQKGITNLLFLIYCLLVHGYLTGHFSPASGDNSFPLWHGIQLAHVILFRTVGLSRRISFVDVCVKTVCIVSPWFVTWYALPTSSFEQTVDDLFRWIRFLDVTHRNLYPRSNKVWGDLFAHSGYRNATISCLSFEIC